MRTCSREGCPNRLDGMHGNARYCSDACKSASWRARSGYRLQGHRKPCQTRKSRGGPSGLQVSYPKAVELVAANLAAWLPDHCDPQAEAEEILTGALSDRQRQRLAARQR